MVLPVAQAERAFVGTVLNRHIEAALVNHMAAPILGGASDGGAADGEERAGRRRAARRHPAAVPCRCRSRVRYLGATRARVVAGTGNVRRAGELASRRATVGDTVRQDQVHSTRAAAALEELNLEAVPTSGQNGVPSFYCWWVCIAVIHHRIAVDEQY